MDASQVLRVLYGCLNPRGHHSAKNCQCLVGFGPMPYICALSECMLAVV